MSRRTKSVTFITMMKKHCPHDDSEGRQTSYPTYSQLCMYGKFVIVELMTPVVELIEIKKTKSGEIPFEFRFLRILRHWGRIETIVKMTMRMPIVVSNEVNSGTNHQSSE